MAPPKRKDKFKPVEKGVAGSENGTANLRQLRMSELAAEFSRQERELKKLVRSLGKKLTGK